MRRLSQAGFIMIVLLVFFNPESNFAQRLTLKDCLEIAKEKNYNIALAKMDLTKYQAKLKQKYANFLPEISFLTDYTRTMTSTSGESGTYNVEFSFSQDIFTGGANSSLLTQAKAELKEKIAELEQITRDELYQVKVLVYRILRTQKLIRVYKEILERRKKDALLIHAFYKVGSEVKANLEQAEAEVSKAELALREAKEELEILKKRLNQAIGEDLERDVEIAGDFQENEILFSFDKLLQIAYENRSEIKEINARIEKERAELECVKAGYFPKVSFESVYGWSEQTFPPGNDNWSAKVSVSLSLFDGFLKKNELAEVEESINMLRKERDLIKRQIEIEVKQAYSEFKIAKKALEVRDRVLKADRMKAELSRIEYKEGRLSYKNLRDAELDLNFSEVKKIDALYKFNLSLAKLTKVQGKW